MSLSPEKKLWFAGVCQKNNIQVSEDQVNQLEELVNLILDWNTKVNLVSRKDVDNIWEKHIFGSLAFLSLFEIKRESNIFDVGTGGGFPGLPLAIMMPDSEFILNDSIKKKINVVQDVIEKLKLPNVIAVCERAESLSNKKEFHAIFDYVIARAVAPASDIISWTKHFLIKEKSKKSIPKSGKTMIYPGSIILMKGGDVSVEVSDAKILQSPDMIDVHPLVIEGIEVEMFTDKKLIIVRP